MKLNKLALVSGLLLITSHASSHEDDNSNGGGKSTADSHAPIGVMGDHLHKKGEWMFSYRYMNMQMDGMLSGKDSISTDDVAATANPLAGELMRMGNLPDGSPRIMTVPPVYRVAPLEMDMKMHMLGAMYGWSDNITLMLMLPYLEKKMRLRTFAGAAGTNVAGEFTGETSGVGDFKFSAMIKLSQQANNKIHMNIGLSFPTGSITEKGSVLPPFAGTMIPAGETVEIDRLAYPMQLGSGSYDLLPGITFTSREDNLSWGSQISAVLRLNDNDEDYKLGNRFEAKAWIANQWQSWISGSIAIQAFSEGKIRGRDDVITGGMPLFVASNSGRDQIELKLGLNLLGETGAFNGHRLAIEAGVPVYQDVNGLQMENSWNFTIGWQKAFK